MSLLACAPPELPPVDAGVDSGSLPDDAGVDAGPGVVDAGTWRVRWTQSLDFPTIIDHHTTFITRRGDAGAAVYVLGGQVTQTSELFDTIFAANILTDGGLGSWERVGTLSRTRAFHGVAANTGDGTFFAGGISGGSGGFTALSEVSVFGERSDGGLGTFTHSFFPQVALHPTLVSVRGQIAMVGGSESAGPGPAVWTVAQDRPGYEVQPDGGVRTLATQAAPLPVPRSHHAAVVYQDHVYVIGGFTTGDQPLTGILRSRHDDAGIISGWDEAGTIEDSPWTHSAFVHEGNVFIVGGGSFTGPTVWLKSVRRAPFLEDGTVGPFVDVRDELPVGRAHVHQTPFYEGFIYSVGGRAGLGGNQYGSIERVDIGRLVKE